MGVVLLEDDETPQEAAIIKMKIAIFDVIIIITKIIFKTTFSFVIEVIHLEAAHKEEYPFVRIAT